MKRASVQSRAAPNFSSAAAELSGVRRAGRGRCAPKALLDGRCCGRPRYQSGSPLPEAIENAYRSLCRGDTAQAFWHIHRSRAAELGNPETATPPTQLNLATIAAALPSNAVFVTIIAAADGGAALAIKAGQPTVLPLSLPSMTASALRALISGGNVRPAAGADADPSFITGYRRFRRSLGRCLVLRARAWREWDKIVQSILRELAVIGWSSIHRWLRDDLGIPSGSEVVFSVPPPIAAMPIAAIADPVTGRCLIDDYAVRLVPCADALVHCNRMARYSDSTPRTVLATIDPLEDLSGSRSQESEWNGFASSNDVLYGRQATIPNLLSRLADCTHYIHYGHGSRSRRRSVLQFAPHSERRHRSGRLSDLQVQRLRLPRNRLSILAACESGLIDLGRPHPEFDGMAGSFLRAGSACVIGSLWSVESESTRWLIERVMSRHLGQLGDGGKLSPAQALRLAQLELRDGAWKWASKHVDRAGAVEPGRLLHLRPGGASASSKVEDELSHAYYWAGFVCFGA